jgi:site-specific DNA-adenine methylase
MKKRDTDLFGNIYFNADKEYGLPYMGNKRKLANKILNKIYETIGDFDNFYDIFGGGGSMSFIALQAGHNVTYNDFNSGVVNLLKHIVEGGELPLKFIDRETFETHKDGDDWFSGFCKVVYSFGNNQKGYLFAKEIEPYKKNYHDLVVFSIDQTAKMSEYCKDYVFKKYGIKQDLQIKIPKNETITKRRLDVRRQLIEFEKKCKQLQQLQRLQQLQQLQQLQLKNLSYENVIIKEKSSVIYCDPPYINTGQYQKTINHDRFYEWALSQNIPVFISEYTMPKNFELVASFEHFSTLSATAKNKTVENLYWNKKETK